MVEGLEQCVTRAIIWASEWTCLLHGKETLVGGVLKGEFIHC